jgi:hypothetical protein
MKLQIVRRRRLQRRPELHFTCIARLGARLEQEMPLAVDAQRQHAVYCALRLIEHQPFAMGVADARHAEEAFAPVLQCTIRHRPVRQGLPPRDLLD